MKIEIVTNDWDGIETSLIRLQKIRDAMERVINAAPELTLKHLQEYLETQDQRIPLSGATKTLYSRLGEPDGSGIRDHINVEHHETPLGVVGLIGIPEGKPSLVARVQEHGAVIGVTDKMRSFLAAHGIYLRRETVVIVIPKRQFWSLALHESSKQTIRKLRSAVRQKL